MTPHFSVGLELPWRFPTYEPYIYFDYQENEVFCFDQQGSLRSILVQERREDSCADGDRPEASFFSPMLTMTLRVPLSRKPAAQP